MLARDNENFRTPGWFLFVPSFPKTNNDKKNGNLKGSGRELKTSLGLSPFFSPFSVIRPTPIFGIFKKGIPCEQRFLSALA